MVVDLSLVIRLTPDGLAIESARSFVVYQSPLKAGEGNPTDFISRYYQLVTFKVDT